MNNATEQLKEKATNYYNQFISHATNAQIERFRESMEIASCGSFGIYSDLADNASWELDVRSLGY